MGSGLRLVEAISAGKESLFSTTSPRHWDRVTLLQAGVLAKTASPLLCLANYVSVFVGCLFRWGPRPPGSQGGQFDLGTEHHFQSYFGAFLLLWKTGHDYLRGIWECQEISLWMSWSTYPACPPSRLALHTGLTATWDVGVAQTACTKVSVCQGTRSCQCPQDILPELVYLLCMRDALYHHPKLFAGCSETVGIVSVPMLKHWSDRFPLSVNMLLDILGLIFIWAHLMFSWSFLNSRIVHALVVVSEVCGEWGCPCMLWEVAVLGQDISCLIYIFFL